jgi:hypothetical protein
VKPEAYQKEIDKLRKVIDEDIKSLNLEKINQYMETTHNVSIKSIDDFIDQITKFNPADIYQLKRRNAIGDKTYQYLFTDKNLIKLDNMTSKFTVNFTPGSNFCSLI